MSMLSRPGVLFTKHRSRFARYRCRLHDDAAQIRSLQVTLRDKSVGELENTCAELRRRLTAGECLDALLPDAFAALREAIRRALSIDMRDTQIAGAIAMHHGSIVEMKTGEGKSLMVLFPALLHSLDNAGVHVATLNPYLAERDHAQAEKVLALVGCHVGLLRPGTKPATRRQAYLADVTYAVYDEFARDYLRDNMQLTLGDLVQRQHKSVFLDEIDAILIDEARAPVTISETHEPSDSLYRQIDRVIADLPPDFHQIDREDHAVYLTEAGYDGIDDLLRAEGLLGPTDFLYGPDHVEIAHHVIKALQAHHLYARNKDYIVTENQVILIDPVTGRAMPGRRFGDGLHQALEAKEGLPLGPETQILSSISIQNYFRIYDKRAGMTATADENADEFGEIYRLKVTPLAPFNPAQRRDLPDQYFETAAEKYDAVLHAIRTAHQKNQPVLVGTVSIQQTDDIGARLTAEDITHVKLTALHNADEAEIIARAGMPGAVTIAANMAGRGTDIVLGGLPPKADAPDEAHQTFQARRQAVLDAGGLLIIGTEKHDSRRIDKQLRGRSGRQGDVGTSVFMLSLEDDFVRPILNAKPDFFKTQKLRNLSFQRWAASFFSAHQKNVEAQHSEQRRQLMRFDNVVHEQRKIIFSERLRLMREHDLANVTTDMREQVAADLAERYTPEEDFIEEQDIALLRVDCIDIFGFGTDDLRNFDSTLADPHINRARLRDYLRDYTNKAAAERRQSFGEELARSLEKQTVLSMVDTLWNTHQRNLERLRSVIGLRASGRRDPYSEYQTEAFALFETMLDRLRYDITRNMSLIRPMDQIQQTKAMEEFLFQS